MAAPAASLAQDHLALWRAIENRVDRWASFGALAVGVSATAMMLLF